MQLKLKNFSISQFNRDVNASQDPAAKFRRWADYRQQISHHIRYQIPNRKQLPQGQRCIVLGAGSLNDIDIALLCGHFDLVVLADIDIEAVRQGIDRQALPPDLLQKIQIVQHDFTGAEKTGLFGELERLVQCKASTREVLTALAENLSALMPDPLLPGSRFELVLSCPVYTQLIFTQIEVLLKILYAANLYSYEDLDKILTAAYQGMKTVIGNYNDLFLSLSAPEGLLIMLADIAELPADAPALGQFRLQVAGSRADPMLLRRLIDSHGLGLSAAGLEDLETKADLDAPTYFLWPFDDERSFVVCARAGHVK